IILEAAGLFPTTTRWPSASPSLSATKRAGISVGPPAPKPTTSRIGRVGYGSSARAAPTPASARRSSAQPSLVISPESISCLSRLRCLRTCVLAEMAQQRFLILQKFHADRVARPRAANGHLVLPPPGRRRHPHPAIREIDRFRHIVRHVDHGLARLPPNLREEALHVVAGERVERRERLIHQQHRGIVRERPRDG